MNCVFCERPLPKPRWWQLAWLIGRPPFCLGENKDVCSDILAVKLRGME